MADYGQQKHKRILARRTDGRARRVGPLCSVSGVPAFSGFIATNRMAATVNELVSGLHLARSEAVKRRTNSSICASDDWNTPNPTCNAAGRLADGWIVFVDCSVPPPVQGGICGPPNLVVDAFDTVYSAHGPMPDTIADNTTVWPVGTEYVSFGANGFPRTIAGQGQPKTDFQLCDHRGNHDTGGGLGCGALGPDHNDGPPANLPRSKLYPGCTQPAERLLKIEKGLTPDEN